MIMNKKRRDQCKKSKTNINNIGLLAKHNLVDFNCNLLNKKIDETFCESTKKCFTNFTEINSPILSREEVNSLVKIYKESLPQRYHLMKNLFGCAKKENWEKNEH